MSNTPIQPVDSRSNNNVANQLIKIRIDEDTEIYVQAIGSASEHGEVSTISRSFDKAFEAVKKVSSKLRSILSDASPDETAIEFSIGFKAETGELLAVFVKSEAEVALKITMTWKKSEANNGTHQD